MLNKRKVVIKIVWILINLLMFIVVSVIAIHEIITEFKVDAFFTLGILGTGFVCVSGLSDIWVEFPDYMRVLKGLNKE